MWSPLFFLLLLHLLQTSSCSTCYLRCMVTDVAKIQNGNGLDGGQLEQLEQGSVLTSLAAPKLCYKTEDPDGFKF